MLSCMLMIGMERDFKRVAFVFRKFEFLQTCWTSVPKSFSQLDLIPLSYFLPLALAGMPQAYYFIYKSR